MLSVAFANYKPLAKYIDEHGLYWDHNLKIQYNADMTNPRNVEKATYAL